MLRGKVLTRDNILLSGVNISILSHPEFGSTMSRADGMFDMAVNGGGLLTVNYEKEVYLTAQSQVSAPWQDYEWLPNVVMIQADIQVTNINLSSSEPIQVAQGSVASGGFDHMSSQQIWASALSGAISGSVGAFAGPLGGSAAKLLGYASNGLFARNFRKIQSTQRAQSWEASNNKLCAARGFYICVYLR